MKNILPLLILIIITLSAGSCGDSIRSSLAKYLIDADKIKVYYFEQGQNTVRDSNMIITVDNRDEVNKILASISDDSSEQFKCGYSGYMEVFSKNKNILNLEFNFDEGCAHYVFRFKDQIYFKTMTPEGQGLLKNYRASVK
jgi:hypothetical protein